jgi:hypothetical protein
MRDAVFVIVYLHATADGVDWVCDALRKDARTRPRRQPTAKA